MCLNHAPSRRVRLTIEQLEDRCMPASASLVADIVPGFGASSISNLVNLNGTLLFTANDAVNGVELWKSDGTAAGTALVKDISPLGDAMPGSLTNVNGVLFFNATDDTGDTELWKSDGTPGGTIRVKNINLGGSSSPQNFVNVNGTLFFAADDGSTGVELWKSDGTMAGTVLVRDIHAMGNSNPSELTNVNGMLFFSADDGGAAGRELWMSDGTPLGTALVKNINPTANVGSGPGVLTNVDGTLYFQADDGTNGLELWKSDGSTAGTTLVKDLNGAGSSSPSSLTNVNGTLFFAATDGGSEGVELWKSDGTPTGTLRVKDINTSGDSTPSNLTSVNGTLFFSATDAFGLELWTSDGTEVGTLRLTAFSSFGGSNPSYFTNVNGTLFFSADDHFMGRELWQSNGTISGTARVKDINVSSSSSNPASLTNVNGTLFFIADNGSNGIELWKAIAFSDDFDRADSTDISEHAGAWTEQPGGDLAIFHQKLLGFGKVNAALAGILTTADVRVQALVSILTFDNSSASLIARSSTINTHYRAQLKNTSGVYTAEIFKRLSGVETRLSSQIVVPNFTDTDPEFAGFASGRLQFDIIGPSLRLYFDGALVGDIRDSSISAAGRAGVLCGPGVMFDNFSVAPFESSLPFGDNFERATSTSLGSQWRGAAAGFAVANKTLVTTSLGPVVTTYTGAWEKDVSVQANVTVLPFGISDAMIVARYTGPGTQNYWAGALKGLNGVYTALITRNVNGVITNLTIPVNVGVGAGVLKLEVIGSSIKLFFNGALVGRAVDARLDVFGPGQVGVGGLPRTTFDNFNARRILPTLFYDGFNRPDSGSLGANWETLAGTVGSSGTKALTSGSGGALGMALVRARPLANVKVEATATVLTTGVSEAQLIARYVNATTYYYAALERNAAGIYSVSLGKIVAGIKTRLGTTTLGSSPGLETATLRFELKGTSLRVLRNGVLALSATDSSILATGMAGLRGTNGVTFEDFTMA